MARIIDARVRQKAATLEEWNNSDLDSLDGEQLFVRSEVDDKVIGFKFGAKNKKFSELDYPDFTVRGKVSPTSTWVGRQSGVYIPTSNGTYNTVEVNLADGYQVLYWDGTTIEKVVYPSDYSGAVFGGAIDDTKDLSTPPTEPTWYIASPGDYNTTPAITLTENSILSWDGNQWSHIPFELEVRGEFLVADNIAEVRNITPEVAQLLVNGTYKGVEVLGYYEKGDTPAPIIYYISDTTEDDDGGSVIEVGGIKLEHKFVGSVNVKYFGAKGDGVSDDTQFLVNAFNYGLNVVVPEGNFNHTYFNAVNQKNKTGFILSGDSLGKSRFVFVGEPTTDNTIDFTLNTDVASNISVKNITFDGNKRGGQVYFYRQTDLDFQKCYFINHIGKTCWVDRSYEVSFRNTKFTTTNDITPECLLYLSTNAVTVGSECYFNGRMVTKGIKVNANSSNNIDCYSIKIENNIFESCTQAVYAYPSVNYESLIVGKNYFELVLPEHIPVYLDSSMYKNFHVYDNFTNASTQFSVVLNKINRRSTGVISNNRNHRPVAIYTSGDIEINKARLNTTELPSVNIVDCFTWFSSEGQTDTYWVPNIIVDDSFQFNTLNITRFSDSRDIRMPIIEGTLYKRTASNTVEKLLPISLPNSGGATYARGMSGEFDVTWRQGHSSDTSITSNRVEKHYGKFVSVNPSLIVTSSDVSSLTTNTLNMTSLSIVSDSGLQEVSISASGQLDNPINEWVIYFKITLMN